MFAKTQTLAVIAACVLAVQAQSTGPSPTETAPPSQSSLPAGLDACTIGCVTEAATQGGCSSFTDLACVCTSSSFQSAALACLQANCTAEDVTAATQLQAQECAPYVSASAPASTGSGAMSSTPAPSTSAASTPASSGTAMTSSTTPSATTTSAAMGLSVPFSFESVFGTLFASAGALLGAAFVL